jgi:integrase/recombinase XerD
MAGHRREVGLPGRLESLTSLLEILGHDRLQTTAIYFNFTDTHIQEEFERKW